MSSSRAPLFSVSLAFGIGCMLGLDEVIPLFAALPALALTGVFWGALWRSGRNSLAAFYILTACAGLVHTLTLAATIPADDLRRLPSGKALDTTQWRGVVIEEPVQLLSRHATRRTLDRTTFVIHIEAWRPTQGRLFGSSVTEDWQPAQGDVDCLVLGPAELQCGDRLEWAGAIQPFPVALSPGDFDLASWKAERGVYYQSTLLPQNWKRVATGAGNWWQRLSFRARDWAYERLQIGLEDDPRTADFLAGMLIGYRQQIPDDIQQDFRRTGTLHVFAVSGQNIAEVVLAAIVLLQLFGLVRWRWAWIIAPLVLLYCLLTGSPASAVRATAMALAILLAWRMGRPLNALGCWSLVFLAMQIWNPLMLRDAGAQLSFGVVLGLILLAPPLMQLLTRHLRHDPLLPARLLTLAQQREENFWKALGMLLAASMSATIISEPITAVVFHQVTPISVVANLIVVPLAGLITLVGTLSIAFSTVSTLWASCFNNANWLFAKIMIGVVSFLAHEPGSAINVPDIRTLGTPQPLFVVVPFQDSAGLFIQTGKHPWLLNAGRDTPTGAATTHLLQYYGVNKLGGLIVAQVSLPENSGADSIARDFRPSRFIVPTLSTQSPLTRELPGIAASAGIPAESWESGGHYDLSAGVSVDVLAPEMLSPAGMADDRALVLLFHAGGQTLLWAGRIGPEEQRRLLATHPDLHADVLVLGIDAPPEETWLRALGVRHWMQIPPRDKRGNRIASALHLPESCRAWPLNKTGSVEIHFQAATDSGNAQMTLRPWVALPPP